MERAAGCVRDGSAAPAGGAEFQADGVVLSADVDSVETGCRAHQDSFATAEFSGIFRATVTNSAAGILGGGVDLWICAHSVRDRRSRTTERREAHVRED